VVGELEEDRPAAAGDAGQGPGDVVVDEPAEVLDRGLRGIGVEDLEEVAEALRLRLQPEVAIGLQRGAVELGVVVEGERVEAEVGAEGALPLIAGDLAALGVVDGGGAEGAGRLVRVVARAGGEPDVGGVVGADGGGDVAVVEQPLLDREHFVVAGAHQHDVDEALARDIPHELAVLGERTEASLLRVVLRALARRRHAHGHVRVLGVGEDEIVAGRVVQDPPELLIEGFRHRSHRLCLGAGRAAGSAPRRFRSTADAAALTAPRSPRP